MTGVAEVLVFLALPEDLAARWALLLAGRDIVGGWRHSG